jgi:hypothetical protein
LTCHDTKIKRPTLEKSCRFLGLSCTLNWKVTKGFTMKERMYGVVLWADASDNKAVIWCEDHGNLAYYSASEHTAHQGVELDAGDLIQFDLREGLDFRSARNLERVDVGYAKGLPDRLRRPPVMREPGNVVTFPTARAS